MQGVQRFVIFAYLGMSLLLWATLSKLFGAVLNAASASDAPLLGSNFTVSTLVALLIAGVGGVVAFRNDRIHGFSAEVVQELKKVTWPDKKETQTATWVVIVTTLIFSVLLAVFDIVWGQLTGFIYR